MDQIANRQSLHRFTATPFASRCFGGSFFEIAGAVISKKPVLTDSGLCVLKGEKKFQNRMDRIRMLNWLFLL